MRTSPSAWGCRTAFGLHEWFARETCKHTAEPPRGRPTAFARTVSSSLLTSSSPSKARSSPTRGRGAWDSVSIASFVARGSRFRHIAVRCRDQPCWRMKIGSSAARSVPAGEARAATRQAPRPSVVWPTMVRSLASSSRRNLSDAAACRRLALRDVPAAAVPTVASATHGVENRRSPANWLGPGSVLQASPRHAVSWPRSRPLGQRRALSCAPAEHEPK